MLREFNGVRGRGRRNLEAEETKNKNRLRIPYSRFLEKSLERCPRKKTFLVDNGLKHDASKVLRDGYLIIRYLHASFPLTSHMLGRDISRIRPLQQVAAVLLALLSYEFR